MVYYLQTSILNRLTGPLYNVVMCKLTTCPIMVGDGQAMLEMLPVPQQW